MYSLFLTILCGNVSRSIDRAHFEETEASRVERASTQRLSYTSPLESHRNCKPSTVPRMALHVSHESKFEISVCREKRGENEREEEGGLSFKHSTESMLRALLPTVSKKENEKKRQKKKERKIGTFIKKKFTRLLNGGNNAKASSRRFP